MANTQTQDYNADAELWQGLQGGLAVDNPYVPFLEPKVIERDGKRFLRIPKNQELQKLAEFFDKRGDQKFKNQKDFVTSYFSYRNGERENARQETELGLKVAKTQYDLNKPYFKPTIPKPEKVGKYKMEKNKTGGLRFTQEQKDGTQKPITAAEYALLSGQNVVDLLAQDPTGNSQKVIDDTNAIETKIKNGEMSAEAGLQALIKAYPWVYGSSR